GWHRRRYPGWYHSVLGGDAGPSLVRALASRLLRRRRAVHPPAQRFHARRRGEQPRAGDRLRAPGTDPAPRGPRGPPGPGGLPDRGRRVLRHRGAALPGTGGEGGPGPLPLSLAL